MTRHGPVLLALSALAIAGWTYNVNYDTRAALDRIEALRAQIAEEREALQVLRVEWAWLNAPDRLGRLVAAHNDRLGLMPLKPEAFGIVAAAPYPKDAPWAPDVPPEAEMLVASAGVAPADGTRLATRADEIVEGSAQEALVEAVAEKAEVLADGGLVEGGMVEGTLVEGTLVADGTLAPAGVLTGGQAAPATMQDAVTLALIEAGVVQPAAVAAVLPAAASGAIPVPPARPAVWARR